MRTAAGRRCGPGMYARGPGIRVEHTMRARHTPARIGIRCGPGTRVERRRGPAQRPQGPAARGVQAPKRLRVESMQTSPHSAACRGPAWNGALHGVPRRLQGPPRRVYGACRVPEARGARGARSASARGRGSVTLPPSVCLSVRVSVCLSVGLSVCPSVCRFVPRCSRRQIRLHRSGAALPDSISDCAACPRLRVSASPRQAVPPVRGFLFGVSSSFRQMLVKASLSLALARALLSIPGCQGHCRQSRSVAPGTAPRRPSAGGRGPSSLRIPA